jgi:hypothetical protein
MTRISSVELILNDIVKIIETSNSLEEVKAMLVNVLLKKQELKSIHKQEVTSAYIASNWDATRADAESYYDDEYGSKKSL